MDLLYKIPEHIDYTSIVEDLDAEDISKDRIEKLRGLLLNCDNYIVFQSAKLLTFWGDDVGFQKLTDLFDQGKLIGLSNHRSYGYDDTLQHVLRAFIRYWADKYDHGSGDVARQRIFPYIVKIIQLSNVQPFTIDPLFGMVIDEGFDEYIPYLKEHLDAIIECPETHGCKVHDTIEFLLKVEPDSVFNMLNERGKYLKDFNVSM